MSEVVWGSVGWVWVWVWWAGGRGVVWCGLWLGWVTRAGEVGLGEVG